MGSMARWGLVLALVLCAGAGCESGSGGDNGCPGCKDGSLGFRDAQPLACGSGLCWKQRGEGAPCNSASECLSGVCADGTRTCAAPTCSDGVQNAAETGTDCGAACPTKCPSGSACAASGDCASGACDAVARTCSAAACADGTQNGDERDVDCGGSCPSRCGQGMRCAVGGDCVSGVCGAASTCSPPACSDGVKNGAETAVDCGGSCATKCSAGAGCGLGRDCASGVCSPDLQVCSAPSCSDGVKNGTETDVDCAGTCTRKCAAQQHCGGTGDCAGLACVDQVCQSATCADGVKNGAETDVDCGGSCARKCAAQQRCAGAADCADLVCVDQICRSATCADGVKNGAETDVDCGGSCTACGYGKTCRSSPECTKGLCLADRCACASIDHCDPGSNCLAGVCTPAEASCSAQKTAHSSSGDGEYWIRPPGNAGPVRAYCDMQLRRELCTELQGAHSGVTREGAGLAYAMNSVLKHTEGVCELWNLRATRDGYPLDQLRMRGSNATCRALGFLADGAIRTCAFGSNAPDFSACGFALSAYYRYGDLCSGCTLNDGQRTQYTLQGLMATAAVMTSANGQVRSSCRIR